MKKIVLAIGLLLVNFTFAQQPYAGIRSSSFMGIHGSLSNPANIVSSTKKWDVNLVSFSALMSNNLANISLGDLDAYKSSEGYFSGIVNADVLGPSFMLSLNSKNAIAITTRARVFSNINQLNTTLLNALTDYTLNGNYVFDKSSAQGIALNGWTEIGASWAHVLYQDNEQILKLGVSGKLLRGFSNTYVEINGLEGASIIDDGNDVYLTNAQGSISIINSGADLTDFQSDQISKSYGNGFGFDIGLVYEKRLSNSFAQWCPSCSVGMSYRYKVAVSLLDVGSIKYTPIQGNSFAYALNIPAGQRLSLSSLGDNIDEIQENLRNSGYVIETDVTGSYKASLPTSLNVSFDYYFGSRFFVEVAGQFNLVNKDKSSRNAYYANYFSATPRFESQYFGFYVPLSYNDISNFNAGAAFRFGPVFLGSGSILGLLIDNSKQADVYVGLRFGK